MIFDFVPSHLVAGEMARNVDRYHASMNESDDYGPLNVDWDSYIEGGLSGSCYVLTVRDEGKLVGYSIFSLGYNRRHKHVLEASNEGFFLEEPYRRHAMQLFKKADEYLKKLGVQRTDYVLKDGKAEKLLERYGYETKYRIWSIKYNGK